MRVRIRIITVVGARPQFIKAAAVSRAIAEHNRSRPGAVVLEKIVHTGQHYDERMSKVFFDELNIPQPEINLGVGSGGHGSQTGQMLEKIERILEEEEPDWCLVYGDTNSTLAGALAAAKLHIPIAHVESGVRSYNRQMPEEINRLVTDTLSSLLFCPTETAVRNLAKEGITSGVHNTGDVMYDSVLYYGEKAESSDTTLLARLGIRPECFFLATIHRAENTDDEQRLRNTMKALSDIGGPECPVILSLHPRTEKMLKVFGIKVGAPAVKMIRPVSYLEMINLEKNAKVILTDSGGIQREAFFLGTPCIVLRDETEWIETVDVGATRLCGSDPDKIASAMSEVGKEGASSSTKFFGNGRASEKILSLLMGERVLFGTCASSESGLDLHP